MYIMRKVMLNHAESENLLSNRIYPKCHNSVITLSMFFTVVLMLLLYKCSSDSSVSPDSSSITVSHLWVNGDTGNDQNSGTSPTQALKTIQRAVNISTYGYIIHIAETKSPYCDYVKINKGINVSNQSLILKGEGNNVVIDNNYTIPSNRYSGSIKVTNSSNIQIENIVVRKSFWAGIYADSTNNLIFRNVRTEYTNSSGIYVKESQNVTIESCEIKDACEFDECIDTLPHECISIVSVDRFLVNDCKVYRTRDGMTGGKNYGGEGICLKGSSRNGLATNNFVYNLGTDVGIYAGNVSAGNTDSMIGTWNIDICRNYVTNTGTGIAVSSEVDGFVSTIFIYNNVIYNVPHNGIVVTKWNGSQTGTKHEIIIAFNTVYKAGMISEGGIAIQCRGSELAGIVVANNIVSECNGFQLRVDPCALDITKIYKNILYDVNGDYQKNSSEIPPVSVICKECIKDSPEFHSKTCPQIASDQAGRVVPEDLNISCKSPGFEYGTTVPELINHQDFNVDFSRNNRLSDNDHDGVPEYEIGAFEYTINNCDDTYDCKAE